MIKANGVMVIIQNNFEHNIHKVIKDEDGRFMIIEIELQDIATFIPVDVQAHNLDCPSFFNKTLKL